MAFRFLALFLLAGLGFVIYDVNLQAANAYTGFRPIRFEFGHALLLFVWSGLAATLMPREIRAPSDLFLFFYVVVCFLWGGALWQATGLLTLDEAVAMMVLLYLPAFALLAARRFLFERVRAFVLPVFLFRRHRLALPLAGLLLFGAAVAVVAIGPPDSFGIDSVYDRRLAGRDALAGRTLEGYAINMTVNGIAPLLGFVAGWRRSGLLFAMTMGYVVLMFWLLGLKSPALNVVALAAAGYLLSAPGTRRGFVALGLAGLIAIYGFVLWEVWDGGYSALADYVVRRISLVQPQVQSYYVELWLELEPARKLLGAPLQHYSDWTFLVGDRFLGNVDTNANTNAFLHALVKAGLPAYLLAIAVISGFLLILDALFARSAMPEFVAIAGLYGILVSEQAYTTALLSSGIFLSVALVMLFSYGTSRSDWKPVRIPE
jgi:xanthosine utilization system XapX-like protein